jgi:hypothetical protein
MTSCSLYSNSSGYWNLDIYNASITPDVDNLFNLSVSPGLILYKVQCNNGTDVFSSVNQTFMVSPANYCAFLTETSCTENISVNTNGTIITRLGNTRGFWLEHQDGNVFITNSRGEIVQQYDTMMIDAQTHIALDKNGNWYNTENSKVPLTDSSGYYVFSFPVSDSWAWVGDNYTIHAVLNGQEAQCNFSVGMDRLTDMQRYDELGKAAGGMLVFWGIVVIGIALGLRSFYLAWRRG